MWTNTRFCLNCERKVRAKAHYGIGTLILAVITAGLWLLVMPFYPARCPICQDSAFEYSPATAVGWIVRLILLAVVIMFLWNIGNMGL